VVVSEAFLGFKAPWMRAGEPEVARGPKTMNA